MTDIKSTKSFVVGQDKNNIEVKNVRIAIDRGGTFTDCYATWEERKGDEDWKNLQVVRKLLSQDPSHYSDAPAEGIRRLMHYIFSSPRLESTEVHSNFNELREQPIDLDKLESVRMGTTVATNALLERQGERLALITTQGFEDILEIGTQARPDIFDLTCKKPSLLYEQVVEIDERVTPVDSKLLNENPDLFKNSQLVKTISGETVHVIRKPNLENVKVELQKILDQGINALAICLLHSYIYPEHEQIVGELARSMGFQHVTLSSELMAMVKIVPRAHSACADAYLTPHIRRYLESFSKNFTGSNLNSKLLFMQSDGGLAPAQSFSGFKAILSGPAAGVVGCAQTSYDSDSKYKLPVIGFDMGGTSTDVSRYAGSYEHIFETTTAGITIQAPQLEIATVAAGGGSRLFYKSGQFHVGPQSVGAHPGPVCYRKNGHLAITDANLVLGRLIPDHFPAIFGPDENLPLDVDTTTQHFQQLVQDIKDAEGVTMSIDQVAHGFIKVANEAMCRPIRALTESKGWDTANHALSSFGGAGGQHACAIATSLGISTVLVHRHASILSAYGLSLAEVVREVQEPAATLLTESNFVELSDRISNLKTKTTSLLAAEGFKNRDQVNLDVYLNLRYQGTDCSVMVPYPTQGVSGFRNAFLAQHQNEFGFLLPNRDIIVDDIRVRGSGHSQSNNKYQLESVYREIEYLTAIVPQPSDSRQVYFEGGRQNTSIYFLKDLEVGSQLQGPALIIEPNSTSLIEPGWQATVTSQHIFIQRTSEPQIDPIQMGVEVDPIRLAIFANRFMSIAEQMGRTLQKTAVSTNIKERLDFSCALFGPDGGLVANAPHIPVHLGSLSFAVQYQMRYYQQLAEKDPTKGLQPGDVLVTNHPIAGGSHLPDITVITPVFDNAKIVFFVASRGHHADIGGTLPGSMPPHSKVLAEEGATILTFKLVRDGNFQTEGITDLLLNDPPRLHPNSQGTRCLRDNLSDLKAQVAANYKGTQLVGQLIQECGLAVVHAYMHHIRNNAESSVRELLKQFVPENKSSHTLVAEDRMDDGSPIKLMIEVFSDGSATFDFTGTGPEVYANFNAPLAVTHSAVLYCIRCLVNTNIPLNAGCLQPLKIIVPKGCLLNPSPEAAVVGGNVTTSQRVCDVVFKAFEACAASQGCCNNLTFGIPSTEVGDDGWGYYETIAGGSGAGPNWNGQSGVHTHMTNTRITDPEILERRYPVLLHQFSIRKNSGGEGHFKGGNGVIREIEFLKGMQVSILSERRATNPYGLKGGIQGEVGRNLWRKYLPDSNYRDTNLGGKNTVNVNVKDRVVINTPGGGGYGQKLAE